jgi:hypothetical protein
MGSIQRQVMTNSTEWLIYCVQVLEDAILKHGSLRDESQIEYEAIKAELVRRNHK